MKSKPTNLRVMAGGTLAFFLALMAFSSLVILTGCNNGPLSVEEVQPQDQTSFFDLPFDPEAMAKRVDVDITIDTIALYENYITVEEGGLIILGESEAADAFVVQPLSFASDTSFVLEVTKLTTADGEMPILYDCEPDGLVFSKPAVLLINAWEDFGKNTESVILYWLNEATNMWEVQDTLAVDATGRAPALISHFSKYGTAKDDGPPIDPKPGGGDKPGSDPGSSE
jgi:hypothetical protein